MTREDLITLFASRQVHWRSHNPEGLTASHSEDCVVTSPIFGTIKGGQRVTASYRDLFKVFPDWSYEGESPIIDGNRAAQQFKVQATHSSELFGVPATGRRLEIHGVVLFEFKDGKIVRERRMYDFTGMLVQLGVLKTKPKD